MGPIQYITTSMDIHNLKQIWGMLTLVYDMYLSVRFL